MPPSIAAFDIETVPDTEIATRLDNRSGDFVDVADQMLADRLEQTEGRTDFLKTPYHRIVTISVAWLNIGTGRFKLDSLGDDPTDEGNLLEAFFRILEQRPTIVSWNGNSFDLPVIRYRAMLHGIDAGAYYAESDRYNNYVNRYHRQHTDLMDVLSGFGAADRVGLDELCRIMGLPGKTVTEGHRVYQHIARGEWEVVETYCELDALNTLMLYLAWLRSRGDLDSDQFNGACELIASTLREDERGDVASYGSAITDWQPGSTRTWLATQPGAD